GVVVSYRSDLASSGRPPLLSPGTGQNAASNQLRESGQRWDIPRTRMSQEQVVTCMYVRPPSKSIGIWRIMRARVAGDALRAARLSQHAKRPLSGTQLTQRLAHELTGHLFSPAQPEVGVIDRFGEGVSEAGGCLDRLLGEPSAYQGGLGVNRLD